jgi:hypothetical protein
VLQIEQAGWSKGLQRLGIWMAVRTRSYQSAIEGLEESLGLKVSKTNLWRVVQQTGHKVKARQEKEVQQAWQLPQRGQVVGGEPKQGKKMGIAMDGVYINLIKEGWKEVKIGAVFEIEALKEAQKRQRLKRQGQTVKVDDEIREMVKATQISYCAVLGSVDEFEPVQWAEAQCRGLPLCWDSVVIGDGAEWIDRIYLNCYYDSFRVIDWYHACEHLATVAHQAFAGDDDKINAWLNQQKDNLWRGQVHQVIAAINRLDLDPDYQYREANYFAKHTSAMNYLEFCEMGLPVGSGVVEGGGCKGVVEGRLKRVGMRWSRASAEHMLILCCEYDSHRWQQIWAV